MRGEGEAVDVGVVGVGAPVLGRLGRLARVPDGQALVVVVVVGGVLGLVLGFGGIDERRP